MGNKAYVNPKKVNDEYRQIHHTYWLFCPRCFHISSVKPFLLGDELYMSLYCKCIFDERQFMPFEELLKLIKDKKAIGNFCKKHKNTPGFLYCIYCEKWLCDYCFLYHKENYPSHLLNHIPVKLKEYCTKHTKDLAVGYCKSCNMNICDACYREQQKIRHGDDISLFGNSDNKDLSEKNFDVFLEKQYQHATKNSELKDEMINNINKNKIKIDKESFIGNKNINNTNINKNIKDNKTLTQNNIKKNTSLGKNGGPNKLQAKKITINKNDVSKTPIIENETKNNSIQKKKIKIINNNNNKDKKNLGTESKPKPVRHETEKKPVTTKFSLNEENSSKQKKDNSSINTSVNIINININNNNNTNNTNNPSITDKELSYIIKQKLKEINQIKNNEKEERSQNQGQNQNQTKNQKQK